VIHHIMVPLDGSATAERALAHAAVLARLFEARLTLAHVPEPVVVQNLGDPMWVVQDVNSEAVVAAARHYLEQASASEQLAGLQVATVLPDPPVAQGLLEAVEANAVDLVAMTTHGHSGFKHLVFGGVADKLIRAAPVPVYLVREEGNTAPPPPAIHRVLVPLDGSELAEVALQSAKELARRAGASLILVQVPAVPGYVTTIPEAAGWIPVFLRQQAAEAASYLGHKVDELQKEGLEADLDVEIVATGGVADGILASAGQHSADIIVMSTHGRSGLGRWMFGSVADRLLRIADRPVWLVRSHPAGGAAQAQGNA
jgi:nucleotide-binding universal stress UspA family protein